MPHSLEVQSGFAEINRWTPLADWRADARHPWRVGRAKSAGDPGSRDSWSANRDHARDSPSSVSGEAGPIQPDRAGFSRIAPLLQRYPERLSHHFSSRLLEQSGNHSG